MSKSRAKETLIGDTCTADFKLRSGTFVATKAEFTAAERMKYYLIKKHRPNIEIRFVFGRPSEPLRPGSQITCARWCEEHGFKWKQKPIPMGWLKQERGHKCVVISLVE